MTTSPLSVLGQPARSLEWLIGPDALLSSTSLATGQLSNLGPIASLIDGGLDLPLTEGAASSLTGSLTGIANQAVLDVHVALENLGHAVPPLNGPIHALTNLGETIGLGKIGEPGHLLTDVIALPSALAAGGGLASAAPVLNDAGQVLGATDGLITSAIGSATASNLLAPDGLLGPVSNLANAAVLDIHANIEGLGHSLPLLNAPLHGLTALGETLGLGHLGTPGNLLTDVVALPGALLSGQGLDGLTPVLDDLGDVVGKATGLLGDVIQVPGNLLGGLTGSGDGILAPVTSLLGGLTGGGAGQPLGGLLGGLAGEGLLAPVTNLLDGVTGGDAGQPLGGLLSPVTSLLDGVTGGADGGVPNLLGNDGVLQPVGDLANGLIDGVHAGLENLGHSIPILNGTLHETIELGKAVGLGDLGEGNNLLTDVINLPGEVFAGNGAAGLGQVVTDVGGVADAAGGVLGTVPGVLDGVLSGNGGTGTPLDGLLGGLTGGEGGVLAPVTSLLDGVTGGDGSQGGVLAPVTSLLDGVTGGDGSQGGILAPVTSLLGGLGGGGAGTHPLIEVAAGPETANPLANLGILSPQADPAHTVHLGAIGVPADQPQLLGADLLTGDSLPLPSAGGGGDSLVGRVLDLVHTSASGPTDVEAGHGATLDLGIAAIDLGGHAEAHHADPTPHGSTGVLHLLGL